MALKFSPGDIVSMRFQYRSLIGYVKEYAGNGYYDCIAINGPHIWQAGIYRVRTSSIYISSLDIMKNRFYYAARYGQAKSLSVDLLTKFKAQRMSISEFTRSLRASMVRQGELRALQQHVFMTEPDHYIPSWDNLKDRGLPVGAYAAL